MTAQTIYSTLKTWHPRSYYIFENITTGVLYVGQHSRPMDQTNYLGSGPSWVDHCEKNGGYNKENICLKWSQWFEQENDAKEWLALFESANPNYWFESNKEWANQVPEDTNDNPRPTLNPDVAKKSSETRIKKGKRLTENSVAEYPTLYMVVMNLSGVYEKIATLHNKEDEDGMWVDKGGDECFYPNEKHLGWNIRDGRAEYITPNKEEAENILTGILVYRKMLKERL